MNIVGAGFAGFGTGGSWLHDSVMQANSLLIVVIAVRTHAGDMGIGGVDCDGEPLALVTSVDDGVDCHLEWWSLADPSPGQHTITIATTGTDRYYAANSIQMPNIGVAGNSGQSNGNGNSMVNSTAYTVSDDILVSALMQKDVVTVATPEIGGIVLVPLLASAGGAPSNENCSLAVSYQRGIPGGTIASTYVTDITDDYIYHSVEFNKISVLAEPVPVVLTVNAANTGVRIVRGSALGAIVTALTNYDERLRNLEARTEHVRRDAWGR